MGNKRWLLKLLSGPHAGAEMPLEARAYRVGRSEVCDVVLHDEMLPKEAFILHVSNPGIQMQRLDQDMQLIEGESSVEAECFDVREGEIYSIGALRFCFGAPDVAWPELALPMLPVPEHQPAADFKNTQPIESSPDSSTSTSRFSGRTRALFSCGVFVLLVLTGMTASQTGMDAEAPAAPSTISLIDSLPNQIDVSSLVVSAQASQGRPAHWLVEGYVQTAADVELLNQHLQSSGVFYELNVRAMENVQRSAEAVLRRLHFSHLVVTIGKQPGELVIEGVQADIARWQAVKRSLLSDIPGLKALVDRVETTEGRIRLLTQWIRNEGLDWDLVAYADEGRLNITSDVRLERSEAWRRIQAQYAQRFGESIDLVMLTNRPSVAIRSVSWGTVPYLVLANGRRYSQGSYVSHGYYLDQIQQDAVVLRRGDERFKYPVGFVSD